MTASASKPRTPAPRPLQADRRVLHWPDASTPSGAVLYGVIGGLIVWLLVNVLSHVHVAITWH
jgi:hypothetical protein